MQAPAEAWAGSPAAADCLFGVLRALVQILVEIILIYLKSQEKKTIQLGLKMFISQYSSDYGLIMAGSVLSLIPVLVVFLVLQKYFVEGVASTGLKG